jgi:hypothetical protein
MFLRLGRIKGYPIIKNNKLFSNNSDVIAKCVCVISPFIIKKSSNLFFVILICILKNSQYLDVTNVIPIVFLISNWCHSLVPSFSYMK